MAETHQKPDTRPARDVFLNSEKPERETQRHKSRNHVRLRVKRNSHLPRPLGKLKFDRSNGGKISGHLLKKSLGGSTELNPEVAFEGIRGSPKVYL